MYLLAPNCDERKLIEGLVRIMKKGWVKLTETQLVEFRGTLNKYLQWEKTAIEKQVEIDKEFPESALSCDVV